MSAPAETEQGQASYCPVGCMPAEDDRGNCTFLMSAYILAGLAMMLNIRLSYSSAPYALIRFKLPENLFSVFVRRMASSLELWCLPSMLLGNIIEICLKLYYQIQGYTEDDNSEWGKHNGNLVLSSGNYPDKLTQPRHEKFNTIIIPSIVTQWLNFLTYVILLIVYLVGDDQGHLTTFYWTIAISGVVFGINMTLVYASDFNYVPVYIAGENSFPAVTSAIHYLTTLMFGNRRKWNSDFIVVCVDIVVAIIISFVAAIVWTIAYLVYVDGPTAGNLKHIFTYKFSANPKATMISPFLMIVVGMGLVYAIYPGIAPGMIVPFYLIDKIEMVLLIATIFPPVIVAALRKTAKTAGHWSHYQSPMCKWGADEEDKESKWTNTGNNYNGGANHAANAQDAYFWHAFDILIVLKITLAVIFIYSLHYRDSSLSRAIVNQPKMSTALTIVFYMCHECLLALGFPGLVGANGGGDMVLIPQYIGALFMIFLAFYSEGYIIEYKSHDPAHWPTDGMTWWNAFSYRCKNSIEITNKIFKSGFDNYSGNFVKII
ncbi:Tpr-related protein family member, putative [Theileria annulata]|uniref:Tpr-related protein family member, putative n=1 Tax=Theileria annulata TaxID=5874 RepID=Q4UIP1_THEAN|nr:Tpr-related protein family member, putative [Theileria annulata]CAI73048.1 Tpr-related protein family member, putative [Theileria annulata]|eukprot:XP_953726.1 Tpr-related protein family member, putative [Theileria annulata]